MKATKRQDKTGETGAVWCETAWKGQKYNIHSIAAKYIA